MKAFLKKIPLLLVILALIAAVVVSMQPTPMEVDVAKVTRGDLQITVDEDGITRIREKYIVASPLMGRAERIKLKPGHSVIANQTVLTVIQATDPSLLDARAVAESEAKVSAADAGLGRAKAAQGRAEAALKQARANEKRAQSEVKYTTDEHNRIKKLFRQGRSASEQELSAAFYQMRRAAEDSRAAQYAVQVALEEQKSAAFAVKIAQHELTLAKAASLRAHPTSPGTQQDRRLEIRSPITGKVLTVQQESSRIVQSGTELLEVGDPSDIEVVIDVLSSDAVRIQPGAKVRLEHWGGPRPLQGTVRLIEPSGKTKISALGVEEQRVNIIIDLNDPFSSRKSLGDGFRVEARIVIWEGKDVIKVPAGSLFRHSGQWAVFVRDGEHARLRQIKIDHNNGLEAEVLEGLKPDEEVVLYPSDKIKDNVLISTR